MADNKVAVKLESSKEVAPIKSAVSIRGLEEIPSNIIPVPFYKLVQPGSTNITLADGTDASPGTIFMMDSGDAQDTLKFALLRAKRLNREFTNDQGELVRTTTIGILGINIANFTPFILNVPVSSFSNFGRLIKQLKDKKAEFAWKFPIMATSEKQEQLKQTTRGQQMVKYFTLNFQVGTKPFSEDEASLLSDAYEEFASSLDRTGEMEETPPARKDKEEENEEEKSDVPF